ncbi:MAG: response regulator [Deltaproteobacteria bacterium]|nr:response regulator [Deltaproteobacteria bacterium]
MSEHSAASFLLVDDDDVFRQRLARALTERGYAVRDVKDGAAALAAARAESPEYAIVDLRLPGMSGLDVVRELRALDEHTRILMLTGWGSVPTAVEAMRLGAVGYQQKPCTVDEVLAAFTGGVPATVTEVSLARAEWELIQRVLADSGNNVSEAARRLKMHRRSLQRKLQKHPPPS